MSINGGPDKNVFELYAELVKKVKAGDESAFTEIYEKTKKLVYVTCYGILNNEQDAEDAMQETYITLYNKITSLEDEQSFIPWLKKMAANKALDKRKSIKDEDSFDDIAGFGEDFEEDDNLENLPDALILEKDKRDTFYKILRKELSDAQFQTILLYYYDELPIADVAKTMDCPVETIKSRLKSARVKIKAGIQDYEKKHNIKLLGGAAAGTGTLGNFFNAYYGSLKIPAIKHFPVKIAAAPKGAVAAKAVAGKAVAGTAGKTAAGASLPKVLGIVAASVLGTGAIGGGVFVAMNVLNDQDKEEKTYEISYDGLYCNIEKSDGINNCFRFYPDGDLIYTSYNFNDEDECFPAGDWFTVESGNESVYTGTYVVDGNDLKISFDGNADDLANEAVIMNNAIFYNDARYKFYEFSSIPGYIPEYTPVETTETSETLEPDKTDPTEKGDRIVTVTDAYYKDEIYEYYPYGEFLTTEDEVERYPFHTIIPQVNISDIDMTAVNDTIMNTVYDHYHIDDSWRGWNNVDREDLAETDYMYYIGEDVVSVVVQYRYLFRDEHEYSGDDWNSYSIFNISIETGELLESSDFINIYGLTDDAFFDIADACYLTILCTPHEDWDEVDTVKAKDTYEANQYNMLSYDDIHPFISPEGHLCFEVGLIEWADGAEFLWHHRLIDTVTQDIYNYSAVTGSDTTEPVTTETTVGEFSVTVTDAVNETYNATDPISGYSYNYSYVVPKVSISGKDMDAVNEMIYEKVDSFRNWVTPDLPAASSYIYYIDDQVVSILVRFDHFSTATIQIDYCSFNISIETGELLSPTEFLNLRGLTEDEFFVLVDVIYQESASIVASDEGHIDSYGSYEAAYEVVYKINIDRMSFDYICPFVSEGGHLCFSGDVASLTAFGTEFQLFDTTSNSRLYWDDLAE